jgi:hypothetical protein
VCPPNAFQELLHEALKELRSSENGQACSQHDLLASLVVVVPGTTAPAQLKKPEIIQ